MFKVNYLQEVPEDIFDIINMYVVENDYNILIKAYRDNYSWRLNSFIDDRMHKNICKFNYTFKTGENSQEFANRNNIAHNKFKEHINVMVKYMKLPKIKKILRKNYIYNAKKIYERNNPTCKKKINCYERELLSQYILSGYYTLVFVKEIEQT
jgi:hypothetical protein